MKLCATPRAKSRAILLIDIASIQPNPHQPRRAFPEASIAALADSIRRHGLLSPLLVRRIDAGRYELIAGERRLRALKSLGRAQAEAIVLAAYDPDCALLALIENLQRENLHYLDEAEAYRAILANQGMTQDALAATLGVSPSALANRLRLLKLPDAVRAVLRVSPLSERHARALLAVRDADQQLQLVKAVVDQRMSVKQLEARIALLNRTPPVQQHISRTVRDNRIFINAVLDTVKQLNRAGVRAMGRVEERGDVIDIIVTIRPQGESKAD